MKAFIKDLKRHDRFIFNDTEYRVKIKYRNDEKPLVAVTDMYEEHLFHYDELEIEKLPISNNP